MISGPIPSPGSRTTRGAMTAAKLLDRRQPGVAPGV
jgi:hypothetical protein